ncbi:zinc-binding dehydrogenase [Kribbella sp. NPDC003505]|uniref:quinone oxidoreductase family protein n=1 Tax=Kribbella sp. NPDC003505 TaxID=3154448 RepID=UPI0033B14F86
MGPRLLAIDVAYAGVNFIDVMARRGDPGYAGSWPFVPGLEISGTVRQVGDGVTDFAVGDRVAAFTGSGGLAEVAVVDAGLVVAIPADVSLEVAAAAPGTLTTAELLVNEFGRLRPGATMLVHTAAGGIGQAVARIAQLSGAQRLIGTVGNVERVARANEAGYDAVLARGPRLAAEIRELTGGIGVDLVLDPQGTAMLDSDLEIIAPGGSIILFGNPAGGPLGSLPETRRLYGANASIRGFSLSSLARTAPHQIARSLGRVLEHLSAGNLHLTVTVVDHLTAAIDAQQALAEGRGVGKYVARIQAT